MREGWTYKKLGEVADISAGQGAPQGENNYCSDGIPFIKAGNLESLINGMPEQTMQKVSDLVAKSHRLKLYKSGSVLFAKSGMSCMKGWVYTLKNDCYVVSHLAVITPHMQKTEGRYLNYYFQFNKPNTLVKDAAYPSISLKDIENISIPVPSLSEQQSIVAELDKINELISLKKAQLSDLDSLAQSIFYDMFGDPIENEKGWEVKKLGEMSSVKTGPFGSMLHKEDYISNGIPLVNPIHIKDYRVIADMDFTISDEKARELNAYILRKNDVIFARRGDIGRCAVISDKENGYLCGTGSLFVRFEQKVIPQYIMYIIRSSSFIKELISKAKGATMLNLNSTTIASLGIPLPPLPLQQDFAKRIELIEQQKTQISSTIKDLETLLASRMQYWFD